MYSTPVQSSDEVVKTQERKKGRKSTSGKVTECRRGDVQGVLGAVVTVRWRILWSSSGLPGDAASLLFEQAGW